MIKGFLKILVMTTGIVVIGIGTLIIADKCVESCREYVKHRKER